MRIASGFLCYRPPENSPDVNKLPAITKGSITFGSFNSLAKISDLTISLWSEILRQLPSSRLLIKARGLSDAKPREHLLSRFGQLGIGPERLELRGRTSHLQNHLEQYHEVDIALDTFPYHGTATTCEALWMGIPVITLAGQTHVQRVGVSLLSNIQMSELIAESQERYIKITRDLAANLSALNELRQNLRARLQSSPITDAKLATKNFESAFMQMWTQL
jgi:predicted O-linked N-acetylglucosamine transferase (SPINDLY family)